MLQCPEEGRLYQRASELHLEGWYELDVWNGEVIVLVDLRSVFGWVCRSGMCSFGRWGKEGILKVLSGMVRLEHWVCMGVVRRKFERNSLCRLQSLLDCCLCLPPFSPTSYT